MSNKTGDTDGQEPSMEDILASIRKILSEDTDAAPEAAPAPAPAKAKPAAAARPMPAPEPEPELEPEPEPEPEPMDDPFGKDDEPAAMAPPEPIMAEEDNHFDEVFELTEAMVAPAGASRNLTHIMSDPTARASTDVLSELARAILDRRDLTVSARSVTLEGMVREMLCPLLKEWLDRNLPYLIERLVKKEIDVMINRAERLED